MRRPQGYERDERIREYVVPVRIVKTWGNVTGAERLLEPRPSQIPLGGAEQWPCCKMENTGEEKAGILLDFGCEFHGSARIFVQDAWVNGQNRANIRLRFGESVSEAITPWGKKGATNDHANRDMPMNVGFLSAMETNETGYRFLYIGLEDSEARLSLYLVQGIMIGRDLAPLGAFRCNDERINEIFDTAVYTVYLNMQEFLWDGIKRDRLVWCGDIYPAEQTILAVYGAHEILKKSLDLQRCITPPDAWMNGMPAYSLWWLISHELFYLAVGDQGYLHQQHITPEGEECLPGQFLDWPSSENPAAIHAGQQALMLMAFEKTAWLMEEMGDRGTKAFCLERAEQLKKMILSPNGSKQAAALLALAGLADAGEMNERIMVPGGGRGYSTFLGFAILAAKGEAGDVAGALEDMREYWGGMLELGATTFWEDFNLDWLEDAGRIDELIPTGKRDVHGERGGYCYEKLRNSLCHAWASGPAPFLMQYVLGVRFAAPGGKKVVLRPCLGDLQWAEGDYPTPFGLLHVRLEMQEGKLTLQYQAPSGVEVTVENVE